MSRGDMSLTPRTPVSSSPAGRAGRSCTCFTVTPETVRGLGPEDAVLAEGETIEFDPPRRLVHSWQALYDPELAAEDASRVTWEIEPQDGGYCSLTVVHDHLEGAPKTAENVAGGWMFILSGLKTLVETGEGLSS
jgi:uncharacterized protein YndB with AHSA1/START domain